jgi:hypothetical protein
VALLLALPIVVAGYRNASVGAAAIGVAWRVVGAGIGEEMFFRGFIQSRVNEAWGRPLRLLGVQFGLGLIVSSVLFGFIHALNPVDYFAGSFHFAWWHGLVTMCTPYGFLRERTGSVVAPAVMHGLIDVLAMMAS